MSRKVKGFGRRPLAGWSCVVRGRRPKASQGGNRGQEGRCAAGRDLWGFEDRGGSAGVGAEASSARSCRREGGRRARSVVSRRRFGVGAAPGADVRTRRGQRCPAPTRGWRGKRSALRGGMRGDGHEVSILMRLGDGDLRRAHAFECLDDDHPAAATRATARGRNVFASPHCRPRRANARARPRRRKHLAGALDVVGSDRAGEQAVVADAVEAAGQHVQEKAADELGRRRASWS